MGIFTVGSGSVFRAASDLGMDSVPPVKFCQPVELGLTTLLLAEALYLNYRLTSKGIDPKADSA